MDIQVARLCMSVARISASWTYRLQGYVCPWQGFRLPGHTDCKAMYVRGKDFGFLGIQIARLCMSVARISAPRTYSEQSCVCPLQGFHFHGHTNVCRYDDARRLVLLKGGATHTKCGLHSYRFYSKTEKHMPNTACTPIGSARCRKNICQMGAVLLQVPLYERMRADDRFIALEMTEKDNNNMRKTEFR